MPGWLVPGRSSSAPDWTILPKDTTAMGNALLLCGASLLLDGIVHAALLYLAAGGLGVPLRGETRRAVTSVGYLANVTLSGLLLPLWIVGSLWLGQARQNAALIAPGQLRRSPTWVWLGWWMPVVSFWLPKQIIDDTWRITAQARAGGSPLARPRRTGLWWGLWLCFDNLVAWNDAIVVWWGGAGGDLDRRRAVALGLLIAITILGSTAYAAWVPVVRGLSRAQAELTGRR